MDMFTGKDNVIVMDIKDYIRDNCGDEIARQIELYIDFYNAVIEAYDDVKDYENMEELTDFYWSVVAEI